MKISRICAFVLLLVVGSVMAFADGINDPKIIIQGVSGGSSPQSCEKGCRNVGVNFSFTIPKSGKGFLFFTNASGKNWTSLTLVEKGVPASAISCSQTLFLSCAKKTVGNSVEIILSGIKGGENARKGIMNGQSFEIGFACVAQSCWTNRGSTMTAHAGTAPEPGTVALMVTGLGAIISRRKLWKSRLKA